MIAAIFSLLVVIFTFLLGLMVVPVARELVGVAVMVALAVSFSLLGGLLLLVTLKKKVKGRLKGFLILTGVSAAGFLVSVIGHNFLYALAVITSQIPILPLLMEGLHAVFFLVGILVCPIGFIVGVSGTSWWFIKEKRRKKSPERVG